MNRDSARCEMGEEAAFVLTVVFPLGGDCVSTFLPAGTAG